MPDPRGFLTTRWSLVLAARGFDAPASRALEDLCRAYWFPLFAYVRRCRVPAHEAEDVVQGFFARLIEKRDLSQVGPEKGRFRSFMLAAIRHHLSHHRAHERAEKRGGGRVVLEIDFRDADQRLEAEAPGIDDPERAFELAWARELLRTCIDELGREYAKSGRRTVFDVLAPELQRVGDSSEYAAHAEKLGLTPGAVKVAVHRLRARFRERLRERIAATVERDEDVEDELQALLRALSAGAS
jgi:RNA polymerase sigma-70 factor (ECF subfamily)